MFFNMAKQTDTGDGGARRAERSVHDLLLSFFLLFWGTQTGQRVQTKK